MRAIIIPRLFSHYGEGRFGGVQNMPAYVRDGLTLQEGVPGYREEILALQRDLRTLGYLYMGIDGLYGSATTMAVRALQYDLLHNDGMCTHGRPARAPVAMTAFNRTEEGAFRVREVNGICDQPLAQALAALMEDPRVGHIPECPDPKSQNAAAEDCIAHMDGTKVPPAFALALARQESGGMHFRNCTGDHFLTVGFEHQDPAHPERITARSYGLGQYTLFHQPPGAEELAGITEPERNIGMICSMLSYKFDNFILGGTRDATSLDRIAVHGKAPLRHCKYAAGDPNYQKDCATCLRNMDKINIRHGTPIYPGAQVFWHITAFYSTSDYTDVPDPAAFPCDWPYAVRRYNGAGLNSYHYQAHVLQNLWHDAETKTPQP